MAIQQVIATQKYTILQTLSIAPSVELETLCAQASGQPEH
jgi:hypothetical protein